MDDEVIALFKNHDPSVKEGKRGRENISTVIALKKKKKHQKKKYRPGTDFCSKNYNLYDLKL